MMFRKCNNIIAIIKKMVCYVCSKPFLILPDSSGLNFESLKPVRPVPHPIWRVPEISASEAARLIKTIEILLTKKPIRDTSHRCEYLIDLKFVSYLTETKGTTEWWDKQDDSNHNDQANDRIANHADSRFYFFFFSSRENK